MIPILAAIGAASYEGLRDAQRLTIDAAPSWGVTSYMEAGVILGPNEYAEFVYQDLVDRDNAGTIPVRIVGTVWSREASDDPAAVVATLKDWNHRIRSEHIKISVLKVWADGTFMSGGALLLEPLTDDPTQMDRGTMTFTKEQIERQTELAQLAGFDMHIHVDGDGSVRTVLDAFEAVRSKIGNEGSRHTICHNTLVHPDDVRRFAELGVIANCTPIGAPTTRATSMTSTRGDSDRRGWKSVSIPTATSCARGPSSPMAPICPVRKFTRSRRSCK